MDIFNKEITDYIDNNWSDIVHDISELIKIKSFKDSSEVSETYPNGKNQAKALYYALNLCKKIGFKTQNHKNIIGIANLNGQSNKEIGFIGHLDVVNEDSQWQYDPYKLTIKDNYMLGRGILDDKGPTVLMLYAIKFWKDNNYNFPHNIKFLFGTDEESGCSDVAEYLNHFKEPDILITPDANFPICYGEKGLLRFQIISDKIINGDFIDAFAGKCDNAVSGSSIIKIKINKNTKLDTNDFVLTHGIQIDKSNADIYKITAIGRSAHAANPYDGIDSLAILTRFILHNNIGNNTEKEFFTFLSKIAGKPDGNEVNINCNTSHLKKLTIIPSMLRLQNHRLTQIFDIRYPECTSAKEILSNIQKHLPSSIKINYYKDTKPMLLNPNSNFINALSTAFEAATKHKATKFTIGGASYARKFNNATSFGPQMAWLPKPAWVGNIHGPNEGTSVDSLKKTLKIYIYTIKYLMELNLNSSSFYKNIYLNN